MKLKSLFAKPVDRNIDGVIKADDEESLLLEVEEYVLTNEVAKRLENFLEAYNNYANANGVWISGFFGSGKSHLLKMLSMLLQNQEVEGSPVLDLFLSKCGDNALLQGAIQKAASIPSKSIRFNIDQKADVISKEQVDALLAVFMKVFDDMCGYFGKLGHIAQFERDLDSRDLLTPFRTVFENTSGKPWEKGREQAILEKKNIAAAYGEVTGTDPDDARDILDRYRKDYRVSIEDFAEKVNQYLEDDKPDNFRLNFFVDEVGQYIADNTKLMTNLQTIAESLATKSRGRAWIIVTAQEDMQSVLGGLSAKQANDFSKIQARFANRLKLTSADVSEVIQRRLLEKKPEHHAMLADLYKANANNFSTLFDFGDGTTNYRNYKHEEHFVNSYPFVPYQFPLFQAAIQGLSSHNAFEGKHSSVGERSMLAVFQDVAVTIQDHQPGQLATFDLMYEGIRTVLKGRIQRSIQVAEEHLDHPFAIRLLKALFLVKYIKEFKATRRNLCVLLHDSFDLDVTTLKKNVDEGLNVLERQTYIQRNGEVYSYLSDEERDIEEEIKNVEVDNTDVASELSNMVFQSILKDQKIRHDETRQDYPFSRKLDERLHGREQELSIHVISPFHDDHPDNLPVLMMRQSGRDELMVIIPPEQRLYDELMRYKRTEKYIRLNGTRTQQEGVRRILHDKSLQNKDRHAELTKLLSELLGKASFYINSSLIEIGGEDPRVRINKAFQDLVTRTYPNLRMLRGIAYKESDVANYLNPDGGLLDPNQDVSEAEQEILSSIQLQRSKGVRTTAKLVIETFQKKPYGWAYPAILCNLAKLFGRGKLEARFDANLITGGDVERALCNTADQANLVLEAQVDYPASQVRALKDFYQEFFNEPPPALEPRPLARATADKLKTHAGALDDQAVKSDRYPFLSALAPVVSIFRDTADKPADWYFSDLASQKEDLLDMKEDTVDPLMRFMKGPPREIYDAATVLLEKQAVNFHYIDGDEKDQLRSLLDHPECYKGNRMQEVKTLTETIKQQLEQGLDTQRTRVMNALDQKQQHFAKLEEMADLPDEQKDTLLKPFEELRNRLNSQDQIAVINDAYRKFEDETYSRLIQELATTKAATSAGSTPSADPVPPVTYVPLRSLPVTYPKAWLETEADVDAYLAQLRQTLLNEINQGNRVQP